MDSDAYLKKLIDYLKVAPTAHGKEQFDEAFYKAIRLVEQEWGEDAPDASTFKAVKSFANKDFEAAKIQAAFLVGDLGNLLKKRNESVI